MGEITRPFSTIDNFIRKKKCISYPGSPMLFHWLNLLTYPLRDTGNAGALL